MTKYIIKRNDNEYSRIVEDEESKNYWITNCVDLTAFEELSDSDYELILKREKWFAANEPFDKTLVDYDYAGACRDFTFDEVEKELKDFIQRVESQISNSKNAPAIWTTSLNTLKNIDLSTLTFPINGCTWVDCLIKNDIQVPSSMEF